MTDRERLIDLIVSADIRCFGSDKPYAEVYADYLLENGVIVPPCKVGDTVYKCVFSRDGSGHIVEQTVVGFHMGEFPSTIRNKRQEYMVIYHKTVDSLSHINFKEIGETVFLTREEAEKALAERSVSNEQKS